MEERERYYYYYVFLSYILFYIYPEIKYCTSPRPTSSPPPKKKKEKMSKEHFSSCSVGIGSFGAEVLSIYAYFFAFLFFHIVHTRVYARVQTFTRTVKLTETYSLL